MIRLDHFKESFFEECEDLLPQLEENLARLCSGEIDPAHLDAAFRVLHSIKGGAGMFGMTRLVRFSHSFESALSVLRAGRATLSPASLQLLLRASDMLAALIAAVRSGSDLPPEHEVACLQELQAMDERSRPEAPPTVPHGPTEPAAEVRYEIRFRPDPAMLRRGIEPVSIIRKLKRLGTLAVRADVARLPSLAELDPAQLYLAWDFELVTPADQAAVRDVFKFCAECCEISSPAEDPTGGLTGDALRHETPMPEDGPKPASMPAAQPSSGRQPLKPTQQAPVPAPRRPSIRVDLDRVDKLVNLVGEMAIAQAMVVQQFELSIADGNSKLSRDLGDLLQHMRNLQDSVMAIRAQPVRTLFGRLPRLVRELEQQLGKSVALDIEGQDTEIDKTVIEELWDPLVHIVRNAVDHGLESPSERMAAGKPETGRLRVSARHEGGRIVVQVEDDGRGIDTASVLRIAARKHLIAPEAVLSDDEICSLLFEPGFSTAERVSDLSGRGVGLDIVKRNVQSLGGRISMRTSAGAGTVTTITLPLTLAVVDGMLVKCAGEQYVVPLTSVVECIVVAPGRLREIPGSGTVISLRGRHIRTIDLAEVLLLDDAMAQEREYVVVTEVEGGVLVGLAVDQIVGQQQVVVKSVRQHCLDVPGIAGATILGNGAVAFILDVGAIATMSGKRGATGLRDRAHHEGGGEKAA